MTTCIGYRDKVCVVKMEIIGNELNLLGARSWGNMLCVRKT